MENKDASSAAIENVYTKLSERNWKKIPNRVVPTPRNASMRSKKEIAPTSGYVINSII